MATATSRPRLRPVESIVVADPRLGRALMLRDTQGVARGHVVLPIPLVPIVSRFTGASTCEQIANAASEELGEDIPVDLVVRLATELETALFVDGTPYKKERARIEREFADAEVRPASHAGGAYHDDPRKLADYIDRECIGAHERRVANGRGTGDHGGGHGASARGRGRGRDGRDGRDGREEQRRGPAARSANADGGSRPRDGSDGAHDGRLVGLVAPHIDPWRGAVGYGAAYGALRRALCDGIDTFVLFGTSHAPMREPFALCRKAFDTPFGPAAADKEALDAIARACDFNPYADLFNHKREHSLEFQAVFLKHVLGDRPLRIIPVLAGLGAHQSSGQSPRTNASIERVYAAIREVVEDRRAIVIAGADMAHVGPRFGDPRPLDEEGRRELDDTDRASLACAARPDDEAFWKHVAADLETRRVCGLGPIYSLLRSVPPGARGEVLHYEQTVDPDEGSIVSHAALGFYA